MVENLVDLFTELSQEIIKNELAIDNDEFESKRRSGIYNKYIQKLRQKCFDVLLRNHPKVDYTDPCKTPYGAEWSPTILILDCGSELASRGLERASIKLNTHVQTLQEKNYLCLGDLLKLIFMLRGSYPNHDDELKPNFLNTVSEYSLKSSNPCMLQTSLIGLNENKAVPSQCLYVKYSTNLFESGYQLLNNLSERSITSEKLSNRHLISISTDKFTNQTGSSTPSDFTMKKKSYSSSSFIQMVNNLCSSNHSLWDNFVEKPIAYKLRNTAPSSQNTKFVPSGLDGSGEHLKANQQLYGAHDLEEITKLDNFWTELCDIKENLEFEVYDNKYEKHNNGQDLYLYPIVKENGLRVINYESCFGKKSIPGYKSHQQNAKNAFFQSPATVILALWEQERKFRYTYEEELSYNLPELRILELEQFLKDVQFLLVGVGTDTFKLNEENMEFEMKKGTCLEGVTSNTLLSFSEEYIDIGTCYVKLSHLTNLHLKNQIVSGFKDCRIIYKVFWMSVYEYLCRHSQYVLKIPVTLGLLGFKAHVKNLHPVIKAVSEFCKVSEPHSTLPHGGQLLSYLLQVTQKISNKYTADVFFGFLKACCETYLIQLLQDWMFQGHLDRHHRDFFVEHRPKKPRCKDRSYYLSFYMFNDRIPSFLKGLENNIFNCGKTIHLLKLIQPESKFCRLLETRSYPKMKLCLSEKELNMQLKTFQEYSENVSRICGSFASIATLKQEEINREQHFERYILKVKKEQEIERELLKKISEEEMRRKRDEQNKWLKKQVELAEEEKRRKKEMEEKDAKLFMQEARRIAEEERRIVEEEKLNMKLYYDELISQIEKKRNEAWSQRSQQLNKKNALMRNYKSNETISAKTGDTQSSGDCLSSRGEFITVDREGNIVNHESLVDKPELDVVNSNVPPCKVDTQIEDIENENMVDINETDNQLQKIVASRIEYQKQVDDDKSLTTNMKHTPKNDSGTQTCEIIEDKVIGDVRNTETEAQKNKKKVLGSEFDLAAVNSSVVEKPKNSSVKKGDTVAERNKKKLMSCEFDIGEKIEKSMTKKSTAQSQAAETEAEKNKRKVMSSEYGMIAKHDMAKRENSSKRTPTPETEAQKNKKKVMQSEYNMVGKCDAVKREGISNRSQALETEAQKNKKKVMSSEYGIVSKGDKNKTDNRGKHAKVVETEAEKNKKKVMASEFATTLETKGIEGKVSVPFKVETEAQRNKKKIMGCEFYGSENHADAHVEVKNVNKSAAQKNKQKFLEIEYGYPGQGHKTQTDKNEESKAKESDVSDREEDYYNKSCTDVLDYDMDQDIVVKLTSFTEKALQIFHKRKATSDELKFFSFKESMSEEDLRDDMPWLSEVQILFEQHIRKPGDRGITGFGFADMDITKFMNCIRKSVLIPLQIQEEIANEALFNHLLKEENMLLHINALRNYFFLNDGEFSRRLTQNIFMTLATCTEPQQFFKRSVLNQIVYEALSFTIHSNEPYTQNVSFEIVEMPEFLSHSSHDVLSPFELSYQVKWPLNIILTEKALSKYKLVFHFLLKLKRINWTLNENFSYLNYSCRDKRISSRILINSPHYHKIHIYRHAMGQFMRTLENYTSSYSLQFAWINFQKNLESAKNLDDLYDKHVRYVKEVLKLCFLTKESGELLNFINGLIELSLKFHYSTKSGKWILSDGKYQHTKFDVLKATFTDFCGLTTEFLRTLRKKINVYHDLKPHEILMEKFDMILR